MKVLVRRAVPGDLDWLVSQLREFDRSLGNRRSLIEDEKEARQKLVEISDSHVLFVAHKEGERLGFIGGVLSRHPLNSKIRLLAELFWWVVPEHRGSSSAAYRLLDAFERIGRRVADWVVLSVEHDSALRDKHLTERGFRQIERAYLLEV